MKEIQKVETLKNEDMARALADIRKANEEMDFFENRVFPYSFPVTVREMVESADDFSKYTRSSKQVLRAEINGLIEIINHWIQLHNEPKVEVEYIVGNCIGKRNTFALSTAEELIAIGLVKRV